jgi:hypothetical protein
MSRTAGRQTMAAGISGRLWEVRDIVTLVEAEEAKAAPSTRGA